MRSIRIESDAVLFLLLVLTTMIEAVVWNFQFGSVLADGPESHIYRCHSRDVFSQQPNNSFSFVTVIRRPRFSWNLFTLTPPCVGPVAEVVLDILPNCVQGDVHWLRKENTKIWSWSCQFVCSLVLLVPNTNFGIMKLVDKSTTPLGKENKMQLAVDFFSLVTHLS